MLIVLYELISTAITGRCLLDTKIWQALEYIVGLNEAFTPEVLWKVLLLDLTFIKVLVQVL
jgi:hypothetical protein